MATDIRLVNVKERTRLYHYLGFDQFVAWVETKRKTLRRIRDWDDCWELALTRELAEPPFSLPEVGQRYNSMFGWCWTTNRESDAMWRIYSQDKRGLRIRTTAAKFRMMRHVSACLGRVVYCGADAGQVGFATFEHAKAYSDHYVSAFIKRLPFKHESEVRLVLFAKDGSGQLSKDGKLLHLDLDPLDFIESIEADPRTDDSHFEALCAYCSRAGFRCVPKRSGLYSWCIGSE